MAQCVYNEHIIFHKLSIGESKFDIDDIVIMGKPWWKKPQRAV